MSSIDQLITNINNIGKTKYIKKDLKTSLTTDLENIKEFTNNNENKFINSAIKIITKPKLNADDQKQLIEVKPSLIKIVKNMKKNIIKNLMKIISKKLEQ